LISPSRAGFKSELLPIAFQTKRIRKMSSNNEKSPKKEKKVVQYAFGTPTHKGAFSDFAHINSAPNLDFAKTLSQSSQVEPIDDTPKKKKRAASEAAAPLMKITQEENPCQRKDCKDVIKALLAGQARILEEKEEIMDELDHINAELQEIELLFDTLDERQKTLAVEKRQLEGLAEQQAEKLTHLEETRKTLQHERDSFGQTVRSYSECLAATLYVGAISFVSFRFDRSNHVSA
jgi:DNA repair exonuclease SbcCD ATPase subunit